MRDEGKHPPSVTDVPPSADDELRHRRRVYTVIMAIHLVGFAVGGALYERAWWTGLIIIIVTGPLQWVAVLIANAASPRPRPASRVPPGPIRRALGPVRSPPGPGAGDWPR
ncbi:MAG TPA: DUF3099 domain-containing protein [Pseudonocardia sp.]